VLWEGAKEGEPMSGYTDNYIPVETRCVPGKRGSIEHVLLRKLSDRGAVLAGEEEFGATDATIA
jgi:hypothetical protein